MNSTAQKHLAAAKDYVARGEEFYRKAAVELGAAKGAGATWIEINDELGRGEGWAERIVAWAKIPASDPAYTPTPFAEAKGAVARRHVKSVLRDAPAEEIAELLDEPAVRAKVSRAQEIAHEKVTQRSAQTHRESIGDEAADAIAVEKELRDAEAQLFAARRALIGTLKALHTHAGDLPDAWREEFLRTVDDVGQKVDMLRSLLAGVTDEEIERVLAGEGS